MKMYFYYGAMGSSKTANALMTRFSWEDKGKKVALLKPSIDNRDGVDVVKSRAGLMAQALLIYPGSKISEILPDPVETYDNLIAASDAEHEEWTVIYRHAADTAKAEGFNDISKAFSLIVDVEKYHQNRFLELAKHVKEKQVFSREHETQWICNKCGYHTISKAAPLNCPLCNHDYSHFQLLCDKY